MGCAYLAGYGDSQDTLAAQGSPTRWPCCASPTTTCATSGSPYWPATSRPRPHRRANGQCIGRQRPEGVAQPGAVLDVAALASASFVEAAVSRTTHAINIGGQPFVMATHAQPARRGHRRRSGAGSRPWRCAAAPSPSPSPCGPRTTTCARRPRHPDRHRRGLPAGGYRAEVEHAQATGPNLRRRLREGIAAMSDAVDRPFRIAFGVLLALSAVSVGVLMAATGSRTARDERPGCRVLHLRDDRHRRVRRLLLPRPAACCGCGPSSSS